MNKVHFTPLHFTSLHFTSLHFTSLHFTSLHFTSLHFTSLHFNSIHFNSLHFTSLHFSLTSYIHLESSYLCFLQGSRCDVGQRQTRILVERYRLQTLAEPAEESERRRESEDRCVQHKGEETRSCQV